ncbi:MAG: DHH family phosphoesterase, partial [Erysipelotrichaceae bacterium]
NNHGMVVKSIQSNRFFVVLNEDILKAIIEDRFSILSATKRSSKHIDVLVTVSMAFARGSNNIKVLDETCNALLELAQSRGGDQVVMRKVDEDIQFFGGNSEAVEKRSKVRVRIMAHTFRDLIVKSSNVIICGHKEMDADCVGAALAMSNIVQLYRKQVSIVSKTGGIEPVIQEVMKKYDDVLSNKHQFVTESEGLNQLQKDTLVIMVDHHDIEISNGKSILSQANKIAIVDHHRRKVDLQIQPILIYVEPGSSSTTELINEFIPYFSKTIDYTQEEANIMYLGLIIDTNNFVARTGSRTFDIASVLRQQGADPILCNQLLKEPYDHFAKRSTILSYAKQDDEIIIALVDNQNIYSRTLISQAANQLLAIKNVEAVFVGAYVEKNIVAISARSLGNINVQVIMEKMHGGGHLTQAATQIQNQSIAEINKELEKALKEYKMEEVENESNLID